MVVIVVGAEGFEPSTSRSRTVCSSRTEPHPESPQIVSQPLDVINATWDSLPRSCSTSSIQPDGSRPDEYGFDNPVFPLQAGPAVTAWSTVQTSSATSYTISSPDPTGCNKLQVRGQDTFGTWGPYYQTDWLSTNDETLYHTFGGEMVAFQAGDTQHASFTNPTTGVYYPATDHLSSVWAVYDASAAPVATTRYYPYGNIATQTGTSPTDRGFTGQEATDFGLLDYHARFYDPYLNRWTSPDPIIQDPYNPQDYDRYSYVRNNPINYNDPSGYDVGCAGTEADNCDSSGLPYDDSGYAPVLYIPNYLYHPDSSLPSSNRSSIVAPPDFNNPLPNGHPAPPTVPGLPNDKWDWNDNWPDAGPGYKNANDPDGKIYRPDRGKDSGTEGEAPHWHARKPNEKGRGIIYPPNPEWGRGSQRKSPGVYDPTTGEYKTSLLPSLSEFGQVVSVPALGYIITRGAQGLQQLFSNPIWGEMPPLPIP